MPYLLPPIIVWNPCLDIKNTLPPDTLCNPLPAGFPTQISSPLVWTGADLQPTEYIFELLADGIAEIEIALGIFKCYLPHPLI
jgi:hypothetical protein